MPEKPLVLVIDDETGSRESMAIALEKAGLAVRTFDDARKALEFLDENDHARLAVCDLRMPGMDGLAFLQEVRERKLDLGVMLVTAYGSIESAVEAMRVGADDYLTKPVDLYELRQRVMNLIEKQQLKEEVSNLREMLDKRYGFESIIGRSAPMEHLFEQMRLVAPTRSSVLIVGESGTGKELVANALHRASPRRNERILAINCGAIPSDILESELFGHERGAFTGAVTRKTGKFELAHRGSLFLDEISELYPELQVKLLRVLETGKVTRIGGNEAIPVDVRVIAASNRRPEEAVTSGKLREDLHYRLNVFPIHLPPLRERRDDVDLLAEHFLSLLNKEQATSKDFTRPALQRLRTHNWPGNVRELKNLVHRAYILAEEHIGIDSLPLGVQETPGSNLNVKVGTSLGEVEQRLILATLEDCEGDKKKAAEVLGISLKTLYNRLNEYKSA